MRGLPCLTAPLSGEPPRRFLGRLVVTVVLIGASVAKRGQLMAASGDRIRIRLLRPNDARIRSS